MRVLIFLAILIPVGLKAQTYQIKVSQLDSLIWMAQKSKTCGDALNSALVTLEAKNALIDQQGKLIELRGSQIANYALLDANWSARMQNASETFILAKDKERRKTKKWRKIAIGESGLLVIVLAVLIL